MKILVQLLVALPIAALTSTYHPSTSGESLVRDFLGHPELVGNDPQNMNTLFKETARGYLDGIKDATEGTAWCYSGRIKPHELNYQLIESIQGLSPAALKGNAAPLVVAALAKKLPCAKRRSKS